MYGGWELILDLLIALSGALLLGLVAERFRVNAIIGYLVAGALIGPGGFGLVQKAEVVDVIAEIGVALLLFTIGLEFSFGRLKRMGIGALLGGIASILATGAILTGAALAFGVAWQAAVVIGAACCLSSTAIVLRVLRTNNDLDTTHGKSALGVLLLQDIAMVPLVLLVTFLSSGSGDIVGELGKAAWNTIILVIGLIIFTSQLVPRLLHERIVAKNRELPIILAVVTCVGATYAAHELKISPALGAFFAGMLLAESKFADQMRVDVLPLRTLFVTVFFVSVGLLADLQWLTRHLPLVIGVTLAVMLLKTVATYLALRPFQKGIIEVLATSLAISQVGEFSFVLLGIGRTNGLIEENVFQLIISVILLALIITPFLTGNALKAARRIAKIIFPARQVAASERELKAEGMRDHIIIVGYGEAGQATCQALSTFPGEHVVLDVDPKYIRLAESYGLKGIIGDATNHELLETARIHEAKVVMVTVSDHNIARTVVSQCKSIAPGVPVVVRSRYHIYRDELDVVGADYVIDEEMLVGDKLGKTLTEIIGADDDAFNTDAFRWDSPEKYS